MVSNSNKERLQVAYDRDAQFLLLPREVLQLTVSSPFCTTVPPNTEGGPSTVITGVPPVCEGCFNVTRPEPTPYISYIPPASHGGKKTLAICPGPVTVTVTAKVPDSSFVSASSGCNYCTATLIVPPVLKTTLIHTGNVPGTATLPTAPGCTKGCEGTVIVTVTPGPEPTGPIVTLTTTGTAPGIETIPPSTDCSKSCFTTIRVTSVPSLSSTDRFTTITTTGSLPFLLALSQRSQPLELLRELQQFPHLQAALPVTTGPVVGTTTITPTCPTCEGTIVVTVPPGSFTTVTTTGSVPGTTTVTPASNCPTCEGTVIITSVPPAYTTTTCFGSVTSPTTTTLSNTGTGTKTVVVIVPTPSKPVTTITFTGTGTVPYATTITGTGTIGIETVITYVPSTTEPVTTRLTTIVTVTGTGTVPSATTITGTGSTGTDTVITFVPPAPQTTITTTSTGTRIGTTTVPMRTLVIHQLLSSLP
ncbi:hypothetical protein H9Q69_013075 [Fusarium xylarioides]|nr:hypothetical protein H9Q69_013075 [Fusarium xylarioides]